MSSMNMPGMPMPPNAGLQPQRPGGDSPQAIQAAVEETARNNPEQIARLRAGIEAGLQSGELDPQMLTMAVQMAQTVLQNPSLYPQLRQLAISRGIADADDLPEQYDQGLVMALLLVGQALAADVQITSSQPLQQPAPQMQQPAPQMQQPAPQMQQPVPQMQQPVPQMRDGGKLPDNAPNQSGAIPIVAHEGEYVIPRHVVTAKGTEFFDQLLERYADDDGAKGGRGNLR